MATRSGAIAPPAGGMGGRAHRFGSRRVSERESAEPTDGLLPAAAGLAGVIGLAWAIPSAVIAVSSLSVPRLGVIEGASGTFRVIADQRWADPASAYPSSAQSAMPGPVSWWVIAIGFTAAALLAVVAMWRRIEPLAAREYLGRRPYDVRGSHPRSWGRARDVARTGGGFSIGRLDGRHVTTDEEAHIAVVAPTRAGKTTRCIIPW